MFWATMLHMLLPTVIWACLRSQRDPEIGEGNVRRYNNAARLLAWTAFILSPILPITFAIILQGKRTQDVWLIRSCFACAWLFVLIGFVAWRETRFGLIVLANDRIRRYSPWLGMTDLAYKDVDSIRIKSNGIVTLRSVEGTRVTLIPQLWADMDFILESINQRVSAGVYGGF